MPTSIDLRKCLNAISDVVTNRPPPLREYDQIYMKSADMLLQTEHVGRAFDGREIVFIGDGDAIGLCLVHLHNSGLLERGPKRVHVLDFDERVVLSVKKFAQQYRISGRVSAELYNVADALPKRHWQKFDGFYSNPPFGGSNCGKSVAAFLKRGFEAVGKDAVGCLVIADYEALPWTTDVLFSAQKMVLENSFVVREMLPEFHSYHLDDTPDLTSCSIVIRRVKWTKKPYGSRPLGARMLSNFYGEGSPLRARYVKDLTYGGKRPSKDHKLVRWKGAKG
jgi:predicted methyltransferase